MTNEVFEVLLTKALTALPPKLQQQAAEVLIVTKSDPPTGAPEGSLVALVQSPANLRLEVYKSAFGDGSEQEVLEKLKAVLSDELSFFFEC